MKGSEKTRQALLESAKQEFLQHGFTGASLRNIAAGANVTTGALYRHFTDKAALFDALVAPVYEELLATFEQSTDHFIDELPETGLIFSSPNPDDQFWIIDFIYQHLDIFRLLLSASEQTAYENFRESIAELEYDLTMRYFDQARKLGYPIATISSDTMHLLIHAQFNVFFDVVLHDMPYEQACETCTLAYRFFRAGWEEVFLNS